MGPNVGLRYFRQMQTCYNWYMIVKGKSPDAGRAAVPTDLVDPAPGSSLRRTGPGGHQPIQAKAHCENDPATPKPGLSDRSAESSTQPSTSAVIFRAWGGTVLSKERRGTTCLAPGARCAGFQRRRVSCGRR